MVSSLLPRSTFRAWGVDLLTEAEPDLLGHFAFPETDRRPLHQPASG